MKKIILILASITVVSSGMAQENKTDFRDKLTFGLKVGGNYSNVYDAQGEEFRANAKFGGVAGAFLAIPIGKFAR